MNKETTRFRFGQNLKALREQRGLSQDRLGELIGLSRKDLISIEKAHVNYGIDKLFIILDVLKPTREELETLFHIG